MSTLSPACPSCAPIPCLTGALEAAPAMGSADIILDLVSTGVTLRENNLKQIEVRAQTGGL